MIVHLCVRDTSQKMVVGLTIEVLASYHYDTYTTFHFDSFSKIVGAIFLKSIHVSYWGQVINYIYTMSYVDIPCWLEGHTLLIIG